MERIWGGVISAWDESFKMLKSIRFSWIGLTILNKITKSNLIKQTKIPITFQEIQTIKRLTLKYLTCKYLNKLTKQQ